LDAVKYLADQHHWPLFTAAFYGLSGGFSKMTEKNTKLPFFGHAFAAHQRKLSTGNCGCFLLFY
jgi:hypothetical protein